MKHVAIRVDSSLAIGTGHLMRCLTLAAALRVEGARVTFVCRDLPGNVSSLVEGRGFPLVRLTAPEEGRGADEWLGVEPARDADETLAALAGGGVLEALVVDHYAIDAAWERRLRAGAARLMVIDDLADRAHDCDLLLDQNLFRDPERRYAALVPDGCELLLGPRYALLRDEFALARRAERTRTGEVRRLLLFFGGIDRSDETSKALQAIASLAAPGLEVEVIVGVTNPHRGELERACERIPGAHLACQVDDIARRMVEADLALGALGTATWERCCVGLPALTLTVAPNQETVADAIAASGSVLHLGRADALTPAALADALRTLLRAPWLVRSMSRSARELVDGQGARRVARRIVPRAFTLRRAVADDCQRVYLWRNDPSTRRVSRNSAPIAWESHQRWFDAVLGSSDRLLLIGEESGVAVGVLRFDLAEGEAEVSIYLAPELVGRGYGRALLDGGASWLRAHVAGIRAILAEVLPHNPASQRLFEAAGYRESGRLFRLPLDEEAE